MEVGGFPPADPAIIEIAAFDPADRPQGLTHALRFPRPQVAGILGPGNPFPKPGLPHRNWGSPRAGLITVAAAIGTAPGAIVVTARSISTGRISAMGTFAVVGLGGGGKGGRHDREGGKRCHELVHRWFLSFSIIAGAATGEEKQIRPDLMLRRLLFSVHPFGSCPCLSDRLTLAAIITRTRPIKLDFFGEGVG